MLVLRCPNCGARSVSEYRFGGEYNPRPKDPGACEDADWARYLYLRENRQGVQKEWWYHQAGCGQWFMAERHTKTHEVLKTFLWQTATQAEG
ncbi:MAG: sarcosine oxidase subunit delta [bacterium]|nr:sarcosine oxidase subunit delta [bacterium]